MPIILKYIDILIENNGNYFVTAGGYQRKGFKASGVWDSAAP